MENSYFFQRLAIRRTKSFLKSFMLLVLFVGMSVNEGWGQSIWTNSITGTNPNTSNPYKTGDSKDANITVSGIGRGSGITGTNANNRYNANGWSTSTTLDANDYFYFTITPSSGYKLNLSSFVYTGQVSTGTPTVVLKSSLDSYAAIIGTATVTGTTIDLSAVAYQNITSAVTFRYYAYNLAASTTALSINDFTFNGTVTPTGNASPSLSTPTSVSITNTTATLGASITYNGGEDPTSSGVVYGTSASPTGNAIATSPNVASGAFTVPVSSLLPEAQYYYRGYATNSYGTGYSSDGTFRTLSNAPTAQATALTGTATSNTALNISWAAATFPSSGATTKGYVLLRATSPNIPSLSNGNGAAPVAGANTTIVSSTITEAAISQASSGLTANTTYNYLLIPYCWDGTSATTYNYLTTSTPTISATTFLSASAITVSNRTASSMDLSWTNGNGSGRIVVARATANSLVTPTNGGSYIVNSNDITDALNGTTGTGNVVVYQGTGNSTSVTGLIAGTQYQFYVYEFNSALNYATAAASAATYTIAAEPTIQATAVTFSALSATGFKIDFTKGDGTNRIVLVKSGSAVDVNPVDANAYTSNTTFSSGAEIGIGNRVVYNGTGTSVTVTGLSANTTYHVAVYEFNGTGGNVNYLTTSPATGSQLSLVTAPSTPTALTFGSVTYNSFTASFTVPETAPDGYLVVRRKGAAISEIPTGGAVYTVGQPVGSVAANEVIYVGTTAWTNENQTGLTDNSTYYYAVYSYAGTGTQTNYSLALTGSQITSAIPATIANAANAISTTGFTANWETGIGAAGYKLDVSTSETFGTSIVATLTEGFESGLSQSGYYNQASALGSGSWTFVDGGLRNTDKNSGTYSCQLKASSGKATTPSLSDIGTLTFYAKANSGTPTLTINKIINDGTPVQVEAKTITSSWVQYSVAINDNSSDIKLQFVCGSIFTLIDDISIGYTSETPSFVSSYNNLSVSGTSQAVTGLNPNSTYYYRVRATSANSTSTNSNTVTAFTAIDGTVDASTLPDCATCDLVVNDGGEVTLNASKSYHSVSVKPRAKLTLNNGHAFAPGTFVLESDATGTATFVDKRTNGNKTSITATVKQYLPAAAERLWWYLASPVSDDASTVFGSNKVGEYSETTRSYSSPFGEATTLVAGKGYVVKMTAVSASNYVFSNKAINTGDISIGVTLTVTETANNSKRGFNLVGNPYPSYLNWDMAYNASTNVRPSIWYRTLDNGSMTFHTYNATLGASVPSTASGYIPPMQAFWVKVDTDPVSPATVSNGTINLTNDMRSHNESGTGNPLKAPAVERPLIRLAISNGSTSDETVIVAHASALDSYDSFDSEKMSNENTNVAEIYSLAGNHELVINGISPMVPGQEIVLGLRPGKAGDFSISSTQIDNIPTDMKVILKDKLTGAETELSENASYNFSSDAAETNQRFSLLFRAPGSVTGTDLINKSTLLVYAQQSEIVVNSADLKGSNITVYTATGQSVLKTVATANREVLNGNFTTGVYFVKVNNAVRKVNVR